MPDIVNPETHHETSDVNVRALLWFIVIFIAFAIFAHLVIWTMFRQYAKMARHTTTPPLSAIARPASASVPQTPRLQPFPTQNPEGQMQPPTDNTPVVDMQEMHAREDLLLNNPGWVDKQKGIVRLPIDLAKELEVQRLNAAPALNTRQPAGGPAPQEKVNP